MNTKEENVPSTIASLFLFLKSKRFRNHFLISLVLGIGALWIAFASLGSYTHHGEAITVPDLSKHTIADLQKTVSELNLRYQVIDSAYEAGLPGGVVVKQDPEKNSLVKQNRIIYITISTTRPPLVKMPNLVDASMRQALALLESYGLKAGKREYRPDPCVNCVLSQTMKGKKAEPGSMIPKGSVIDLVLGQGQDGEKINVPCLSGLTRQEAIDKIAESGFSEGAVVCSDCKTSADKEKAKVYRQSPGCSSDNMVDPGSGIDLYLSITTAPADTLDEE